jgi:hypothetical protein
MEYVILSGKPSTASIASFVKLFTIYIKLRDSQRNPQESRKESEWQGESESER